MADPAIISGASAIGGALVGALAGGEVDWRVKRRRDRRDARAAARLVRADLAIAKERMDSAIEELLWWPFYDLRMDAFNEHRGLLAGELSAEDWVTVSQSAMELHGLGENMLKVSGADLSAPHKLQAKTGDGLFPMRANAIRGFNALCALADDSEELPTSDPPGPGSKPRPGFESD